MWCLPTSDFAPMKYPVLIPKIKQESLRVDCVLLYSKDTRNSHSLMKTVLRLLRCFHKARFCICSVTNWDREEVFRTLRHSQ